jgi:hypothetical protein
MLAKGIKFKPQPYKHPERPTQKSAYAPYPDSNDLQYRGRPRTWPDWTSSTRRT